MLRINQNQHAGGAKSYYTADYYVGGGQELPGQWCGIAAERLGLHGEINREDWEALCDGLNPATGERLMQRMKSNRTICYDFNFHVPKSVSLLYAVTRDERLLDAFRESAHATMEDIEAEMQTRVRRDGKNEDRTTGNMAWGEFIHFTSRPVDGTPDPHLHMHAVVFNATFDSDEGKWKAGQFRGLKRDAPYFEAVFHSRLSHRLAQLGLPIERTRTGWELASVPRGLVEKFSRRTALIDEKAREKGIDDPEAKAELGAKTRSRKAKDLTMPELQSDWRGRLTPCDSQILDRLEGLIGSGSGAGGNDAAKRSVEYAISHEFERRSVVPERRLLATALRQGVGEATVEQVRGQLDQAGIIRGERDGCSMATTRQVLAEEQAIIDFARNGRGACGRLGKLQHGPGLAKLDASQEAAVRHIVESRDRVTLLRGVAGSGKTTLMKAVARAIEDNGTNVLPLAPTADASRGVLREAGFTSADTVARLLLDERLQQSAKGKLLWIDEAGLLGARTMAHVFDLAERLECRVLLTGDKRQHGAVERGSVLQMLEEEAGLQAAEVKDIKRQAGEYRAAVKALSEGRIGDGFDALDRLGWIREVPDGERYKQLAADYVGSVSAGKSALVVCPTHAEGELVTAEIRRSLKDTGLIGANERRFEVLVNANLTEAERSDPVNYRNGDVLQFHQNGKGFRRGQRLAVNGAPLPLGEATRFSLFHTRTLNLAKGDVVRITHNGLTADGKHHLNNGGLFRVTGFDRDGNIELDNGWKVARDFGHIAHGFAVTSHKSQGKTFDRVIVGQSSLSFPASSREQFYVSCSRGREAVAVYCDDKEALREAVSGSEERLTAAELVSLHIRRQLYAEQRHAIEQIPERSHRLELVHER